MEIIIFEFCDFLQNSRKLILSKILQTRMLFLYLLNLSGRNCSSNTVIIPLRLLSLSCFKYSCLNLCFVVLRLYLCLIQSPLSQDGMCEPTSVKYKFKWCTQVLKTFNVYFKILFSLEDMFLQNTYLTQCKLLY